MSPTPAGLRRTRVNRPNLSRQGRAQSGVYTSSWPERSFWGRHGKTKVKTKSQITWAKSNKTEWFAAMHQTRLKICEIRKKAALADRLFPIRVTFWIWKALPRNDLESPSAE